MKPQTLPVAAAIALSVGVVQMYFRAVCWHYISVFNPLVPWLFQLGLRGAALRGILVFIDLLINGVLSIPAAYVLVKLRPVRIWTYLALSVVPSFVWLNRGLVGNAYFAEFWDSLTLKWLNDLLPLPLTVWLIYFFIQTNSPSKLPEPVREPRVA